MMVLEDSANGCRAAVAAGAFTVAVPNRHTLQSQLPGAQFVADTLADPRILDAPRIATWRCDRRPCHQRWQRKLLHPAQLIQFAK